MENIYLTRFSYSPWGTFGRLYVPFGFECFTVERPWHSNARNESCIPEGEFRLRACRFHRGGYDTLEVLVPGRSHILFHRGNTMDDVLGCICPGTSLGFLESRPGAGAKWGVLESGVAFDEFMGMVGGDSPPAQLVVQFGFPSAPARLPVEPPGP